MQVYNGKISAIELNDGEEKQRNELTRIFLIMESNIRDTSALKYAAVEVLWFSQFFLFTNAYSFFLSGSYHYSHNI